MKLVFGFLAGTFLSLVANAEVDYFADNNSIYKSLICKLDTKEVSLRLSADLVIAENGTAELSNIIGVTFSENDKWDLRMTHIEYAKTIKNDKNYKAKDDKWANHVRFKIPHKKLDKLEILLSLTPKTKDVPFTNSANTGIERTFEFHSGLQLSENDQSGNRFQMTCSSTTAVIDRK